MEDDIILKFLTWEELVGMDLVRVVPASRTLGLVLARAYVRGGSSLVNIYFAWGLIGNDILFFMICFFSNLLHELITMKKSY